MGPSGHFTRMWTRCGRCELFGTGCHVIGTCCIFGRAPRTNETLPDFREWCRVTRHPRVDGLSTDTREMGRHSLVSEHRYTTTLGLRDLGLGHGHKV